MTDNNPKAAVTRACTNCGQSDDECDGYNCTEEAFKASSSPSKRDATEVRRYQFPPRMGGHRVVHEDDHTAAIQASLAREAALERSLAAREAECRVKARALDSLALQAEKVGRMRTALEAIKAFDPGDFRPLADEIKIWELADAALKEQQRGPHIVQEQADVPV